MACRLPNAALAMAELKRERPELVARLGSEQERASAERTALASGEYESTRGDPDLYKYFCQRYRTLVRSDGLIGVVLPRAAFVNKGSEGFREWLFKSISARRIDFLSIRDSGCLTHTRNTGSRCGGQQRAPQTMPQSGSGGDR